VLTGPDETLIADHDVRLDTACWQFEAFIDLPPLAVVLERIIGGDRDPGLPASLNGRPSRPSC
jgi:hypothetical protein